MEAASSGGCHSALHAPLAAIVGIQATVLSRPWYITIKICMRKPYTLTYPEASYDTVSTFYELA